jgi:hypothetical protein
MPDQVPGPAYPFAGHYPDQTMVRAAAAAVLSQAGDVEILRTGVDRAHQPARTGVSGLLSDAMDHAPVPVFARTRSWLGSVLVAGGAVRLFGDAIQAYNAGVNDLNRRYWANKSELPTLRAQHARLEQDLDDAATRVAAMLDKGPDDKATVLALYQAGTLPMAATAAFGEVDFRSIDRVRLYENLLRTGRIGDDVDMASFVEGVDPHSPMDGGRSGGLLDLIKLHGLVPAGWQNQLIDGPSDWLTHCVRRTNDPACTMSDAFEPMVLATAVGPGHRGVPLPVGIWATPKLPDPMGVQGAVVIGRDYRYDVEQLRFLGAQRMDDGTLKLFYDSVTRRYVQEQFANVGSVGPEQTGISGVDDQGHLIYSGLSTPLPDPRHVHQNWLRVIDLHPDGSMNEE